MGLKSDNTLSSYLCLIERIKIRTKNAIQSRIDEIKEINNNYTDNSTLGYVFNLNLDYENFSLKMKSLTHKENKNFIFGQIMQEFYREKNFDKMKDIFKRGDDLLKNEVNSEDIYEIYYSFNLDPEFQDNIKIKKKRKR